MVRGLKEACAATFGGECYHTATIFARPSCEYPL